MGRIHPSDVIQMRGFHGVGRTSAIADERHVEPLSSAIASILKCRFWGPSFVSSNPMTTIEPGAKVELWSVEYAGDRVIDQAKTTRYIVHVRVQPFRDMVWWVDLSEHAIVRKIYLRGSQSVQKFAWEGNALLDFLREV